MAEQILFRVEFLEIGFTDDVHVVARGYDHAAQLALEYMRTLPQSEERRAEIDDTFIASIERICDDGEFGGLVICSPKQGGAHLRPVS